MATVNLTLDTTAAIFEKMYFNQQIRDWMRANKEAGVEGPCPYFVAYTQDAPCRLSAVITTSDDPALAKYGNALVAEIRRRFMPQEAKKTRQPGGRPRDADNLWAYAEVNTKRRAKATVYKEWRDRLGVDRCNALSDAQDSFNKAVKPRGEEKE